MARPIQLRYNDAQNGETVIGTYLTDDNLINDAMLKNSGSGEYTRLEITGDKQLLGNLPIDYTSFGTAQNGESEPEILVYTYEASSSNFILRDRVFPEDAGTVKDNGDYRNDNLWGFQKWVGRQRVTGVSLSNATITEIVDALLPSGYTAVTPAGDSVPTVDNYSYTGNINGALRDIIRDYPVKIWFTANLDGNNDYKVKVESKGFGGVIQTVTFDDERQTEGYSINSFQPEDKSNIVNKVEIIGKASDGTKIQEIVDNQTSIDNHGERYIKRNVGYVQDSSQATSLANSILSPDPSPHAEMSIPFQEDNQLNGSVDILDDRYGIDAVYTIVKQRDFFTEGRTEVELGFEKNRTEKRRNTTRDLDERNNQLFTSSQTDVGGQTIDQSQSNTTTAQSDIATSEDNQSPDVNGESDFDNAAGQYNFTNAGATVTDGFSTSTSVFTSTVGTFGTQIFLVCVNAAINGGTSGSVDISIDNEDTSANYFDETFDINYAPISRTVTIMQSEPIDGDEISATVTNNTGASAEINLDITVDQIEAHRHTEGTYQSDSHNHNVDANDAGHGDTTDPSTHELQGQTETGQNINTATEEKTDR